MPCREYNDAWATTHQTDSVFMIKAYWSENESSPRHIYPPIFLQNKQNSVIQIAPRDVLALAIDFTYAQGGVQDRTGFNDNITSLLKSKQMR
jgi:hypothetical protein